MVIPYFLEDDPACVTYVRTRAMFPIEGHPYRSPKNVPQSGLLYNAHTIPNDARYLIVPEGELKGEAATQLELHSIGLPGMNANHQAVAEFAVRKGIPEIYVIFDTEDRITEQGIAIQTLIDRAARHLQQILAAYERRSLRVRLPLMPGEPRPKMDLDRYLYRMGDQANGRSPDA